MIIETRSPVVNVPTAYRIPFVNVEVESQRKTDQAYQELIQIVSLLVREEVNGLYNFFKFTEDVPLGLNYV